MPDPKAEKSSIQPASRSSSLKSFPARSEDYRSSSESNPVLLQDDRRAWSGKSTPTDKSQSPLKSLEAGHVNVRKAEADFEDLNNELKETLRYSQSISRAPSHGVHDVEKGSIVKDGDGPAAFNLESVLRGDRTAADEAGIKLKEIGVLWKDLTVRGVGGTKNYVKTFPMAFVTFFNVFGTLSGLFGLGQKFKPS